MIHFSHYLRLLMHYIHLDMAIARMYRGQSLGRTIATLSWALIYVFEAQVIGARVGTVYGWSGRDLVLAAILFNIFVSIFYAFCYKGLIDLAVYADDGRLDYMLSRPADIQFTISFQHFTPNNLARVVVGIGLYVWYTIHYQSFPSLGEVLATVAIGLMGSVICYSIWLLGCTLSLLNPEIIGAVERVTFTLSEIAKKPDRMLYTISPLLHVLFFPVVIMISVPMRALAGRELTWGYLLVFFLVTVVMCTASRWFLFFVLRRYRNIG